MPEKTLNELPRELRMLYTKGFDAFQRENYDYAIELFNQVLIREPAVYEVRQSLRTAQAKKSGGRGGLFKRAFNSASSSPMVAKGQIALRKNPAEAIQIAEQILNGDAQSSGAHKIVAEAALAMEMPRTAIMSLEALLRNTPNDKELSVQLADAWVLAGDKTKAEKVYTDLQKAHPMDNEIFQKLKDLSARQSLDEGGYGALASGKGSYRDVLKNKAESISLEQENRQVKSEDATESLMQDYEKRLKTEPTNLKLLRNMAELCAQKGQFDRALTYYDQITAVDGGNDASVQRQIAETKVKRFNHTLSQLDTTAPDYEEKAAQIKAERQAYQLEECKQRSDKYPTDLQIRFELGQLYYDAGKVTEAIQEFQKARSNPNRRISSMIYLAQCFGKRGMNDLAARNLQEALKEKVGFDDEKKELVYTLGCLLEKMGKKEEAMEQFKVIYEMDIGYKDVAKKVDDYYAGGGT